MLRDLRDGVGEAARFVWIALRALRVWRRDPPIRTPAELAAFVETRSKYVAQRTLFGYVKARAGTRYVSLFEDETFAASVDAAKWEVYLACLSDLAVYAAAAVGRGAPSGAGDLDGLALAAFRAGLSADELPAQRRGGFAGDERAFASRVDSISWPRVPADETVFAGSLDALVYWAPVADELKRYDVEALRNSMRFQWKAVRDQLAARLDAESVAGG